MLTKTFSAVYLNCGVAVFLEFLFLLALGKGLERGDPVEINDTDEASSG